MSIQRGVWLAASFGVLLSAGQALAQDTLPAPARQAEPVQARRAAARPRTQTAQTPASARPAPDSEQAKAFVERKASPQPPRQPLPPLSTLMLQPPANTAGTPAPYATRINLNRASLEQIQSLPGVGP